jgi:hypothetical protein
MEAQEPTVGFMALCILGCFVLFLKSPHSGSLFKIFSPLGLSTKA